VVQLILECKGKAFVSISRRFIFNITFVTRHFFLSLTVGEEQRMRVSEKLTGGKQEEAGKNSIMRSFKICTPHQVLLQ
jgi:hypothetical protein